MPPAAPPPAAPPPGNFGGGGGFAPPPAQPYGGAGGGGQMPQLDVGSAISYGWKKFTENLGQFIILMLAVFVASVVIGIIRGILTPDSDGVLALLWSALVGVVFYVITSIIQAGVIRAGLGVTQGQPPSVSQLTETSNIANYILTVILVGIGLFIGLILCVIPGIIWFFLTAYAPIHRAGQGCRTGRGDHHVDQLGEGPPGTRARDPAGGLPDLHRGLLLLLHRPAGHRTGALVRSSTATGRSTTSRSCLSRP
jgi:hypothetical protein